MKKIKIILVSLIFSLCFTIVSPNVVLNADNSNITYSDAFPDDNLASVIADWMFDTVEDYIDPYELSEVTYLDISYSNIASLEGLDYLSNLESLNAGGNLLESVDFSNFSSIEYLNLESNNLSDVLVDSLSSLKILGLSNNQLSSINLKNMNNLLELDLSLNKFSSLETSSLTTLVSLDIRNNDIKTIDLSGLTNLSSFFVYENPVFEDLNDGKIANKLPNLIASDLEFSIADGWKESNGKHFYFENGNLLTGWINIDNAYYYIDYTEGRITDDVYNVNGINYGFDKSGKMIVGWGKANDTWVKAEANGALNTGWIKSGKNWYYAGYDGLTLKDERSSINGSDYYFDANSVMVTNKWIWSNNSNGKGYYYYDSLGHEISNQWKKDKSTWYYFDYNGLSITSQKGWIDGNYYYFDSNSKMVTNEWVTLKDEYGTRYMYTNSSGKALTDTWKKSGSTWYYFDYDGITSHESVVYIDDKVYYFDSKSRMVTDKWISSRVDYNGNKIYSYYGGNGVRYEDKWLKTDGHWYHFDKYGETNPGDQVSTGGKTYAFDSKSRMITSKWINYYGSVWQFAESNGVLLKNSWKKSGGEWYYMNEDGYTVNSDFKFIKGYLYYFDEDSHMVTGNNIYIGGFYQHFDSSGRWIGSTLKEK